MTNADEFKSLLRHYVRRSGVEDMIHVLEKSDFFIAPASTRFHGSYQGGLVKHSISVFNNLMHLREGVDGLSETSEESIAIVSLLHDVCKTGYYKVDYRNAKNERGQWEKVPYYTIDDKFPYGHGEKSVIMIQECMKLTTEELMAIRWHMGAYSGQQDWNTLGRAFDQYQLAMYLHFADMMDTHKPN